MVLPGVHTCFDEGVFHAWRGRGGDCLVGLGVKRAGSRKPRPVGSLLGYLTAAEKMFSLPERQTDREWAGGVGPPHLH